MEIPGYTLMHRIGQGRFASLYLAKNTSGEIRAIKIIKSSLSEQELFRQEFKKHINSLATINHPNCIKVYDAGIVDKQCYIAMDYFPDGSIAPRLIFGFPVKQIIKIILELIKAVEYLKNSGLKHRNIQPRNIFITKNNQTVLSEYEVVSKILNDCPEIKFQDDNQLLKQLVDYQTDVNCLGLLFFKLLNRDTTPHLEIPIQNLSGRRAVCWQPTMNKLFSNKHDDTISDIFQLRNEIYRVQNEFKERINQDKNKSELEKTQKISKPKFTAKDTDFSGLEQNDVKQKKSDLVLLATDIKQTKLSLLINNFRNNELDLQSFLLDNKAPILTGLTAMTGFVIVLSLFTYFDNKYDSSNIASVNNRPDILFPQQYAAVDNKIENLLIESEPGKQLTEADLRQKERLNKFKEEQKSEEERLVILKLKQEEERLIVLKQKKEELIISLQQKQEDDRLIALKLKKQKLLIAQKKISQQQLALKQKKEQKRLAQNKKKKAEEQRSITLNKKKELAQKQKQLADLEKQKILRQQRMDAARLQAEKEELVLQDEQREVIDKKLERTKTKPKFESFATF